MNPVEEEKGDAPARDWCVYLLTCVDGTLYCGVTKDLPRRLDMHNGR
ncbi:MAG: GIY-YIG nuclease family protein, partial [Mailhella sp.]|nr:GIY-YIG nuclease family protein [Mailhella sp.]